MGLIFYLSCRPAGPEVQAVPIYFDIKLVHLGEYGFLSLLYSFALAKTTNYSPVRIAILSIFLTYIYGVSDELHQMFVPERSARFVDTITNLIGATIFQAGMWGARLKR